MYTDPKIINPQDLSQRAYITFYFNGERYRYYNGNAIEVKSYPNRSKTLADRERLLLKLQREFGRALLKGWSPLDLKPVIKFKPVEQPLLPKLNDLFGKIISDMAGGTYSKTYQRDISSVTKKFVEFLTIEGKGRFSADQIDSATIERFLQQFASSGTYYQNKRRTLTAAFSKLVNQGYCKSNPVLQTSKRKVKAVLHEAYTSDQIGEVLNFLRDNYPNLHLCALLMYGTALRPHQEIRLLNRRHFNSDFTKVTLDGSENKGGRIRTLPVPEYVREQLLKRRIQDMQPDDYIFTGAAWAYNESYFNTMWSRAKVKMLALKLINKNQTLYSFRHAAAINVFNKTQNLKLLQQLFDHSNLNTSLTYLRSIGIVMIENSQMPELPAIDILD